MRVLRAKAARKALHFYKVTHGVRDPYTLLVDGTFVQHALVTVKTPLASRVERVLGRDVTYAVPGPVLDELRSLGEAGAAAGILAKRFDDRVAGRAETPVASTPRLPRRQV